MNHDEDPKKHYQRLAADLWAMRSERDELDPLWREKTVASLQESGRFNEAKLFSEYRSDGHTSKMWILPDGHVVSLNTRHYYWILANAARVATFGIDVRKLPVDEEDPTRHAALKAGFVRVNYDHKSGGVVFEGLKSRCNCWQAQQAICYILLNNRPLIGNALLNLFDDQITQVLEQSDPSEYWY